MKTLFPVALAVCLLIACTKETDDLRGYKSKGTITGEDFAMCICCSGFFVKIDSTEYRSFDDSIITNSINYPETKLPVDVYLDWEPQTNACWPNLIKISRMEPVN